MSAGDKVRAFFEVEEHRTSIRNELLAGFSSYLALSYIFVVNPAILSQAGMDPAAVLFATALASGGATLMMGLWARHPFVLAPGMEMNAYVAFFAVGALGLTWQQGLGAVFWSGVIFLLVTLSGLRRGIIEAIPHHMKAALSLSVGTFLAVVALQVAGVLRYDGARLAGLGDLWTVEALLLVTSLVVVLALDRIGFKAAVVASIAVAAVVGDFLGLAPTSAGGGAGLEGMLTAFAQLDLGVVTSPATLSVIVVLFLVDFYGSVAKFIGLTAETNLMVDDELPRMERALTVDGAWTVVGSGLGTTSITTYVESAVGIGVGGRTGLTAVVCGVLMLVSLFLAPLLQYVPVAATTGALVFVAIKLVPSRTALGTYRWADTVAIVAMQLMVIGTFALDRAMLVGFGVYAFSDVVARRLPNTFLTGSMGALAVGWWLQS